MSTNYKVEVVGDITTIRFTRKPDVDDLRTSIDEAATINKIGLRLWDFNHVGIDLTSAQLAEIAEYAKTKFMLPSKVAIVASEDLSFGLSRVYEAFRKQEGLELEIFRTESKAIRWLEARSEYQSDSTLHHAKA